MAMELVFARGPAQKARPPNQTIGLGALWRSRRIDQQNQISVKARLAWRQLYRSALMLSTQDDAAWRPCVNKALVLTRRRLIWFRKCGLSKTLSEQVGHLDKESSPVATESRLELVGKGTEAVAVEIVVVSDIESRSRIRRPAKQKLSFDV